MAVFQSNSGRPTFRAYAVNEHAALVALLCGWSRHVDEFGHEEDRTFLKDRLDEVKYITFHLDECYRDDTQIF